MPRFVYREGERYFKNCSLFTRVTWILELSQFLPCFICSLIVENLVIFRSYHYCKWSGIKFTCSKKKDHNFTTWKPFCWEKFIYKLVSRILQQQISLLSFYLSKVLAMDNIYFRVKRWRNHINNILPSKLNFNPTAVASCDPSIFFKEGRRSVSYHRLPRGTVSCKNETQSFLSKMQTPEEQFEKRL